MSRTHKTSKLNTTIHSPHLSSPTRSRLTHPLISTHSARVVFFNFYPWSLLKSPFLALKSCGVFEFDQMATRNRTLLFKKYRDSLKSGRSPAPSTARSATGPVIEMATTSLINPNRSYAPLSTEDPGTSRYKHLWFLYQYLCVYILYFFYFLMFNI